MDRTPGCGPGGWRFDSSRARKAFSPIEKRLKTSKVGSPKSEFWGKDREDSHSGQLHEFRKLEGAIPTQVQILYPPHFCTCSLMDRARDSESRGRRFESSQVRRDCVNLTHEFILGLFN